ncbi:MAG: hypothetical protein LBM65_02000 [Oscillospiraceae bacterium]|jgi:hypothetical protein|nr:hypothetical protein [Oscillospiraceae bacterium]
MNDLQEYFDAVIAEIKARPALEEITFINHFSGKKLPSPLKGCVAAVGVGQVEKNSAYLCERKPGSVAVNELCAVLEISVYCNISEGGRKITENAIKIANAIEASEFKNSIGTIKITPVAFDNQANAIFRTVQAEFLLLQDIVEVWQ